MVALRWLRNQIVPTCSLEPWTPIMVAEASSDSKFSRSSDDGVDGGRDFGRDLPVVLRRQAATGEGHHRTERAGQRAGAVASVPTQPPDAQGGHGPATVPDSQVRKLGAVGGPRRPGGGGGP